MWLMEKTGAVMQYLALLFVFVVGRFRHIFSTIGEFFRQCFFAMDREELPFSRA